MNIFTKLMAKIFNHAPAASASAPASSSQSGSPAGQPASAGNPAPAPAARQNVDVAQILDGLNAKHSSEDLDWRKSIVDLMKLVGMESSLSERKELADELGYTGDKSDSASMNVWLHKQVLRKLQENGGSVPADLLD